MKRIKQHFSQKDLVESPGADSKNVFRNIDMWHIKLKPTTHAATWLQIFCPQTHPRPQGWDQKVIPFLSESRNVAYQIKGN